MRSITLTIASMLALVAIVASGHTADKSTEEAVGAAPQYSRTPPAGTPDSISGGDSSTEPRISGAVLPEAPFEGHDSAVGLPAPLATGTGPDGTTVTIGLPLQAVMFMAHWCPACQAELPELVEQMRTGLKAEGVELIIVTTFSDGDAGSDRASWLAAEGWQGRALLDGPQSTSATLYGVSAVPTLVLIDADGLIRLRKVGRTDPGQLQELLNGLTR